MHKALFRRLIATAALLVLVAAAVVSAVLVWRVEDAVRPDVGAKLEAVGRTIAGQVGLAVGYGIPFDAIPGMDAFLTAMTRDIPEINGVRVIDTGGAPLYAIGAPADGPVIAVPVVVEGAPVGAVVLGLAAGHDAADTAGLLALLGAVAVGAALLGAVGMALAAGFWLVRPLVCLKASLDGMAAGDFAVEPPENAVAEIGALARQAERLRLGVERRHADFRVEVDEIALAQPDATRRAAIEALAAPAEILVEAR